MTIIGVLYGINILFPIVNAILDFKSGNSAAGCAWISAAMGWTLAALNSLK